MNIDEKALYIYDDYNNELLYILLFKDHREVEEAVNWWCKWYEGTELAAEMPYQDKRDLLLSRFECTWIDAHYPGCERLYF